jgi:hypothetical protein
MPPPPLWSLVTSHADPAGRVPQEDTGRATAQHVLSDIRLLPPMLYWRFSRVGLSRRLSEN